MIVRHEMHLLQPMTCVTIIYLNCGSGLEIIFSVPSSLFTYNLSGLMRPKPKRKNNKHLYFTSTRGEN